MRIRATHQGLTFLVLCRRLFPTSWKPNTLVSTAIFPFWNDLHRTRRLRIFFDRKRQMKEKTYEPLTVGDAYWGNVGEPLCVKHSCLVSRRKRYTWKKRQEVRPEDYEEYRDLSMLIRWKGNTAIDEMMYFPGDEGLGGRPSLHSCAVAPLR